MEKHKRSYTPAEKALAEQLFNEAKAAGTLKTPRALAAIALSDGYRRSISASTVTYRDYLRDARRVLASRPRRRAP